MSNENNQGGAFDFVGTPGYDIGFFECFKDPLMCLGAWCCPCLLTGLIQGQIDKKGFNVWVKVFDFSPVYALELLLTVFVDMFNISSI